MKVRKATEKDVRYLTPRLREADLLEIRATGYTDPELCLMEGLQVSDACYVAVDGDDNPVMIGGVAPSPEIFMGYGWVMASTAITKHWIPILRNTSKWINSYRGHYRLLTNVVHEKNELHIRWLRWAGFSFLRRIEMNGEGFFEFARIFPLEQ